MIIKNQFKIKRDGVKYQNKIEMDPITKRVAVNLLKHVIAHPDNPMITYQDLSKLCGGVPHYHLEMDRPLGNVSHICKERGLPPVSVVVCTKEDYMPAPGFFKEFFPGVPRDKWLDIFVKCFKEAQECDQWEDLLDDIE